MRLCLLLAFLLASSAFAQSEVDTEVRQLQAQLAAIQQEQQSVYQQFQMIQTLRRDEFMAANPPVVQNSPVYSMGNPPPNYDDLVREKQAREDHIHQYTGDLNGLYARYQTLQEQKKALLARLQELTQPK